MTDRAESVPARFRPGDRVRVRRAAPPGHVRTPWYCRGREGIIERQCGAFANPEELAYRRPGLPAQPLYRVRFPAQELWPEVQSGTAAKAEGRARDSVDIEIYQHWLERA